jgi:hypothetical protein
MTTFHHCPDYNCSNSRKILRQFHLLKDSKYSELFQSFSRMSDANVYQPTPLFLKPPRKQFTNSTRDRSVTMMLLAIVALFLLCNGLAFCNSIVESVMLLRDSDGESSDDEWERQIVKWFESSVSR